VTKLPSIVTKTGDGGKTSLNFNERITKDDYLVEAYGSVDELGCFLGLARAEALGRIKDDIFLLQKELFILGAELATSLSNRGKLQRTVTKEMVDALEEKMISYDHPDILKDWAIPGKTRLSAALDIARASCRRAERGIVHLFFEDRFENKEILKYINRLSDFLWLMARWYEVTNGQE